jgi:hypothetical protein
MNTQAQAQRESMCRLMERELCMQVCSAALVHDDKATVLAELASWFDIDWMFHDWYKEFMKAVLNLVERGTPLSVGSLRSEMGSAWDPMEFGDVLNDCAGWWHMNHYAREVYNTWRRAAARDELEQIGIDLQEGESDIDIVLEQALQVPNRYAPRGPDRERLATDIVAEMIRGDNRPDLLTTGLVPLDELWQGIEPGEFVVVGARTGDGKSSFLGNLACMLGFDQEVHSVFFSLEMNMRQMATRFGRWYDFRGRLEPNRREPRQESLQAVQRLLTHCLDLHCGSATIASIEQAIRAVHKAKHITIVFVDYLQLVRSPDRLRDGPEQVIADVTGRLKRLALDLGIVVVAAGQLNRQAVRDGKTTAPQIAHLRYSGAIEQDADKVILLSEPPVDRPCGSASQQAMNIACAKNRNGPVGLIEITWDKPHGRYLANAPDWFEDDEPPQERERRDIF